LSLSDVIEMRQERALKIAAARALHDKAAKANRDFTGPESREYDKMMAEIRTISARVDREESLNGFTPNSGAARGLSGGGGSERGSHRLDEFAVRFADQFRAVGTGSAGAPTQLDYQGLFDRLAPHSVALQTGPTVVETDRTTISIPHLLSDMASGWFAENASITATDPTLENIQVTPTKAGAITVASRELADDSDPAILQIVADKLMRSVGLTIDLGFFEGSGSSSQPRGLKNTAGITNDTTTMTTNGTAFTNLDPLLTAIGTLEQKNVDMSKVAIVMHGRSHAELLKLKDSQNRYLSVNVLDGAKGYQSAVDGIPIYICNQLSTTETQGSSSLASSAYVFDASQVLFVRAHAMRVEMSYDAFFGNDQVAIRAVARVGVAVPNPLAVYRLAGIL
jgi:HK97 family phage major capsid protein